MAKKRLSDTILNTENTPEQKVPFNVLLPESVHRKIKIASALTGRSMTEIITGLINDNITI